MKENTYILFWFFPPDSAFLDIGRRDCQSFTSHLQTGHCLWPLSSNGKTAYEKEKYVRYMGMHS